MKKALSLVMCIILIIMMMPRYVSAVDIPEEDQGVFEYRIKNESALHEGKMLQIETSYDYKTESLTTFVPALSEGTSFRNVTTNSTTSSIIKITLDDNYNGLFENDEPSATLEVLQYDPEITQTFDVMISDEYITIISRQFQDYSVVIKDQNGNLASDVYSFYDSETYGIKRIIAYVPDSDTYEIQVNGVNEGIETPVPISYYPNSDNFQFDSDTNLLSIGELIDDESAMFGGLANETIRLYVIAYRDKLGLMELNAPDGTRFTGETQVFSETIFTDNGNVSSNYPSSSFEGVLPILLRDDYVGVDYSYLVISPENTGMTQYANTPFVDITSKLSSQLSGIVDLGTTSLQVPSYKGYVFRSDGVTQVSDNHVSVTTVYTGDQYGLAEVYFKAANGTGNEFYIAPLGLDFSVDLGIRIMNFYSDFKTLDATISFAETEGQFSETTAQLVVTMNDDLGNPLPQGVKSIQAQISRDGIDVGGELGRTHSNQLEVGGFEDGDRVTLWFNLNTGSFDYLRLYDSSWVTFEYTSTPGDYTCTDKGGNTISYSVDNAGMMHMSLNAQKSQLFGRVMMGDSYVQSHLYVKILDPENRNLIAWGSAHPAFLPDSEVLEGVISIAHDFPLEGEYIISVEDPKDTIYYTGTEFKVTFPLTQDLIIDLPESRAYGQVQLTPEDEVEFSNNFLRVFVNIFDETGRYIKNARVRNDGLFSVGDLANGRYFSKVFVSPFSPLADRYATSKMHLFELDSASSKAEFSVPLIQTIGKGTVTTPNLDVVSEAWVNIINSQGNVIESIMTNELGEFSIPVLNDGKYTFKALAAWGYFDSFAQEVTILNNTITGSTTLQLTEVQLFGAIYDDMNELTSGTVYIYDALKHLVTTVYSSDGYFAAGGFVNGNYFIQVNPDHSDFDTTEMIPFTQDDSRNWQDIPITLKLADYSGRVSNPVGTTVTEGWVHLYKELAYVKSVTINADGTYSIGGIDASGAYRIIAESQGKWSKMMTIGENKVNDIALESEQVVQGTIKLEGELFSRGEFVVYNSNYDALLSSNTNAFGEFTLVGLEPGTYYVAVIMGETHYMAEMQVETGNTTVGIITLIKGE